MIQKMNQEVKTKWVTALKSGEYEQGRWGLRNEFKEFCCLGVLCDLAEKEGVVTHKVVEDSYGKSWWAYGAMEETQFLPKEVMEWADLNERIPLTQAGRLSYMNDLLGYNFKRIAERIDKDL